MIELVGTLVIFVVVVALGAIADGFILSKLWGWFMVGTFSLPALSIAESIGFMLTIRFSLARKPVINKDESKKSASEQLWKALEALWESVLLALFILLMGYVVHRFFL